MGIRASVTAEVILEDVEVPTENLIGEENDGFMMMVKDMEGTRPTIGAQALGMAEGALNYAFNYVKERQQFQKPLIEFQGLQFKLADMVLKVEAARALLYQTTRLLDEGFERVAPYSAMAKLLATDTAMQVTTEAVQLLGGYGYIKDHPVERMMRDAKVTQIYEGTNEIQRLVIIRWMQKFGYPFW